jgi:hypothetical protein
MGKASRRKKDRRNSNALAQVSSRTSPRERTDYVAVSPAAHHHPIEMTVASGSRPPTFHATPKERSPNWGGRRANQTGRPRLYSSDEERLAAVATRRRAARAVTRNPPPKPRGRLPKEEPKGSWGGARKGAGRPLIYKTPEERRARNSELSRLGMERWLSNPENARLVEESRQNRTVFANRTTGGTSPRNPPRVTPLVDPLTASAATEERR